MKIGLFAAALTALVATQAVAADDVKLDGRDAKISYAVGLQIGDSLKAEGIPVDQAALAAAIADVMAGRESRLSEEAIQEAMVSLQTEKVAAAERAAAENKAKGAEYLAANKQKPGVKVTDSGLQYKVIQEGTGKIPSPADMVTVHYRGTLLNGEEFDSSYSRNEPASFPVNGVIKGWEEVLQLMHEGEKIEVAIPSDLAYGERGTGHGIGPNETLLFEIELLAVQASPHAGFSH
ncbi:MAG: FKBP-type peptidyl-prolyl cis-trans isomerase [Nitrospirae bacterium]|nr:FKBP-type peptidyl-prolyl cis-trans isomerase [Nitrospirota bacterium]